MPATTRTQAEVDMTLIAPTEPPLLKLLGRVSLRPEHFGSDVLWATAPVGTIGVQRKTVADLLASITDGRLAKETSQMQVLDLRVLIIEGRPTWTVDGELVNAYGQRWTRSQHRRFLWSMRSSGVWVDWSDDLADTVGMVKDLEEWTRKAKHGSLMRRPGAKGAWGKATTKEWAIHFLQGFDGIGADTATRIWDRFGGLPLAWLVDEKELMRVHGVGKVRAKKMVESLRQVEREVEGAA